MVYLVLMIAPTTGADGAGRFEIESFEAWAVGDEARTMSEREYVSVGIGGGERFSCFLGQMGTEPSRVYYCLTFC